MCEYNLIGTDLWALTSCTSIILIVGNVLSIRNSNTNGPNSHRTMNRDGRSNPEYNAVNISHCVSELSCDWNVYGIYAEDMC